MIAEYCVDGCIQKLDFDTIYNMMTTPIMLTILAIIWFIPLLIYFIIMCTARGRSANGQVVSKRMIFFPNSWYAIIVFGLIQLTLFILLLIFPIWAKIFQM